MGRRRVAAAGRHVCGRHLGQAREGLTLARDPIGIKPLFVTEQYGGLAFASEINALRALPGPSVRRRRRGRRRLLLLWPHASAADDLQAGSAARAGPRAPHWTHRRGGGPAFLAAANSIRAGLSETIGSKKRVHGFSILCSEHMLSDVPVGAFLSGGVDSPRVAAAMASSAGANFKAFTVGFPGSPRDETAAAARIAQHLGIEHVVLPMQPQTAADVLPAVQAAFDEPTAANSAVPLWYLSRAAAEHVKVVLCGEGGDEVFLGYNRQRWAQRMARWKPLIESVGRARAGCRLPELPWRKWNYGRQLARQFVEGARLGDGYERFFAAVSITTPDASRAHLQRGFF